MSEKATSGAVVVGAAVTGIPRKVTNVPSQDGLATCFTATLTVAFKFPQHGRSAQFFSFCGCEDCCFACIGQSGGMPSDSVCPDFSGAAAANTQ